MTRIGKIWPSHDIRLRAFSWNKKVVFILKITIIDRPRISANDMSSTNNECIRWNKNEENVQKKDLTRILLPKLLPYLTGYCSWFIIVYNLSIMGWISKRLFALFPTVFITAWRYGIFRCTYHQLQLEEVFLEIIQR